MTGQASGMADNDWIEIYRSRDNYPDEKLREEFVAVEKQCTLYTAQAEADKSYTKDLTAAKNRLHAITRVQNERRYRRPPGYNNRRGSVDFSDFRG